MNGWLDEVRITKGVALYASDSGLQCRLRLTRAFKLSRRSPAQLVLPSNDGVRTR